jgi:hypothetical protein
MEVNFEIQEINGRPMAVFVKEAPPREWLLTLFLEETVPPEVMKYYKRAIEKAEKGVSTEGNSGNAVGVDVFPDKLVIEELFYEGDEPQMTEISLSEAKELLLEWEKELENWKKVKSFV